mgnify:CR=1 FL=1
MNEHRCAGLDSLALVTQVFQIDTEDLSSALHWSSGDELNEKFLDPFDAIDMATDYRNK